MSLAPFCKICWTCFGVKLGLSEYNKPTAPDTNGAANDVPEKYAYELLPPH